MGDVGAPNVSAHDQISGKLWGTDKLHEFWVVQVLKVKHDELAVEALCGHDAPLSVRCV